MMKNKLTLTIYRLNAVWSIFGAGNLIFQFT